MLSERRPNTSRILYVVGQLSRGGLERQLYYLITGMDRTKYRPAIVVWNSGSSGGYMSQLRALGVPLYLFDQGSSPISKLIALRGIVRELRPEVVHSFSFYTNCAAYLAGVRTSTLTIGSLRSDIHADIRRVGKTIGLLSARWPPHQVSNNFTTAEHLRFAKRVFAPKHVHIVRNAVDLQLFRDHGRHSQLGNTIVGVGSLLPVKRWDRLLTAAYRLKCQGYRFVVRIAGEGPLHGALLEQTARLGISAEVTFLGEVTDIPQFISEGTFLVHVSDTEGCPNAVMEGMACGRAVIATRVGDVRYLVDDDRTGFVVDCEDTGKLADRMARLLDDPELCARMGMLGRQKAEQEFGMMRFVDDMLGAYRVAGWRDVTCLSA